MRNDGVGSWIARRARRTPDRVAVIHAGETITPAGGGGSISVTVNGWVGNDQDIAEKIRNVLIRTGRNTTGGALGRFA